VFVHIGAVERAGMSGLAEGQELSFDLVTDQNRGKTSAENCARFGSMPAPRGDSATFFAVCRGRSEAGMRHKFYVGQTVQLLQGGRYFAASSTGYKIVRQLPEANGERTYRIKSAGEAYERVVKEDQLVKD
jgi:hypothetical protein